MNGILKTLLAAGLLTFASGAASASTWNFAGSLFPILGTDIGNPAASFLDTTGTDSLTAIAINTEQPPAPRLNQNLLGLGVNIGDCIFFCVDDGDSSWKGTSDVNQLDNIGDDEGIVFDMGGMYWATSITLSLLSADDAFTIWGTNDASVTGCTAGGLACLTAPSTQLAAGSGDGIAGIKTIGLSGAYRYFVVTTTGGSGDGYRVKALQAAAIPLPAAGWLLLAGLGGLLAIERRRKAAA
jgi:hypothetical protein